MYTCIVWFLGFMKYEVLTIGHYNVKLGQMLIANHTNLVYSHVIHSTSSINGPVISIVTNNSVVTSKAHGHAC